MSVTYKYALKDVGETLFPMRADARVLHAGMSCGKLCVWVLTEPSELPPFSPYRLFVVLGTGQSTKYAKEVLRHVSTVFVDDEVWHVFEVIS
jgi:hypothetical protein